MIEFLMKKQIYEKMYLLPAFKLSTLIERDTSKKNMQSFVPLAELFSRRKIKCEEKKVYIYTM